jgi:type I restriction enzyme M protein
MVRGNRQRPSNGSALDFEAQLWAAADKMRGHMDASEYKHVCLGLIFLMIEALISNFSMTEEVPVARPIDQPVLFAMDTAVTS